MQKIGIIINPNAKKNSRRNDLKECLEQIVGESGAVRITRESREIYLVAEEFLNEGVEILAISGGDGTMQHTLSRYIEVCGEENLPFLASIRGGTMNTIANSLRIKGTPETIIQRIMHRIHSEELLEYKEIDLMRVGKEYGSLFGIGLTYNFLDAYYEGGRTGALKAIKVILRAIMSACIGGGFARRLAHPVRARVSLDGREIPFQEFSAILACTIQDVGLGFQPLYRAEEQDGYFHILATNMNTRGIVYRIPKLFLGKPIRSSHLSDEIGRELIIEPEHEEVCYMLDGELFTHAGPLHMKTGPRIRVVSV